MTANVNNRIIGMKLSVCTFIRFTDSCNIINNIKTAYKVNVNMACVANETENCVILAFAAVNFEIKALEPFNKVLYLSFVCSFFYCYNLFKLPPKN